MSESAGVAQNKLAGTWRTTYGRVTLSVNGGTANGTYSPGYNGKISGTVNGSRLEFKYRESGQTGQGWFELSPDGNSFRGKWQKSGGTKWKSWNGELVCGAGRFGISLAGFRIIQTDLRRLYRTIALP